MAPKKILVADDEKDIVEIVCEFLEMAGYETLRAYDGQQALETITRARPDAVILDVKMPGLDGFGVIERLRANPAVAHIPVVVFTTTQIIRDAKDRFRHLGVLSWISKPFEPDELLAAVVKTLQKDTK